MATNAEPALTYDEANLVQRGARRLGTTAAGAWVFARVLHHVDRPVFRLTRGRHTLTSVLTGLPVVMLTTTGARSGLARTLPVLGLPTAEGLVVVASNYGQRHHPAWHYNLRADPRATVTVRGRRWNVHAVALQGDRRARVWQEALRVYPGFAVYERRASQRTINVYVLEPV